MVPAMRPCDAWTKLAHGEVERVSIDALEDRITAVLLTPYPPGIPLLIPGEKFNHIIIEYLKFTREFNKSYPGFETDVHGLITVLDSDTNKVDYYVDCVVL
jgi:arginine decarboxylase